MLVLYIMYNCPGTKKNIKIWVFPLNKPIPRPTGGAVGVWPCTALGRGSYLDRDVHISIGHAHMYINAYVYMIFM